MNAAIISSKKDKASINIKENLITNFSFNGSEEKFDNNYIYECTLKNGKNIANNQNIKLYTINSELIFTDDLDKKIDADIFVFISKHRAQEDRASLTCHAIGNFGKAEHGGKERALCYSNPALLKKIFIELNNNAKEPYEATLEATHHGPYMEKPVCFVELGSNEKYWEDKNGGFIVAKSLMGALGRFNGSAAIKNYNEKDTMNKNNNYNYKTKKNNRNYESTFVIGGSHYNHVANKAMLNSNLAVGHICAKHNLWNLDIDLIKQAMEKITPKPKFVLLEWKGLGKEKKRILDLLERSGIEWRRNDKEF